MDAEVLITHSEEDHNLAKQFVDLLKAKVNGLDRPGSIVCTSLDEHKLSPGSHFDNELAKIAVGATIQVGIISNKSLQHQYVVAELAAGYWGSDKTPLLLLAPDATIESTNLNTGPFKAIDATSWNNKERVIAEIARLLGRELSIISENICLTDKIRSQGEWTSLQNVARQAAAAAGMAAATLYRSHTNELSQIIRAEPEIRNPSLRADLEATITAIQVLDGPISQIATRLGNVPITYLAEDSIKTKHLKFIRSHIGQITSKIAKDYATFSQCSEGFQILIDGIDGTGSFGRGIPLFCSSVAILIDGVPRVSAIYDPIHHILYSGHLPGPKHDTTIGAEAQAIELATGNRIDLKQLAQTSGGTELSEEAIGFHLTRTSLSDLSRFFRNGDNWRCSVLEGLSRASGGMYALNSGLIALVDVARGALGGFVNVTTNLWDVAAGQVLIEACGGKVTLFSGAPINYSTTSREEAAIDVVAAKKHLHDKLLKIASGSAEAWEKNYFRKEGLES